MICDVCVPVHKLVISPFHEVGELGLTLCHDLVALHLDGLLLRVLVRNIPFAKACLALPILKQEEANLPTYQWPVRSFQLLLYTLKPGPSVSVLCDNDM
jgi:hypothetical protein